MAQKQAHMIQESLWSSHESISLALAHSLLLPEDRIFRISALPQERAVLMSHISVLLTPFPLPLWPHRCALEMFHFREVTCLNI